MTTTLRATKIFDLDQTLCRCGVYYAQALGAGAAALARASGLAIERMLELLQRLDLDAVHLPGHAWGRERFPNSFRAAAYAIGAILGMPLDERESLGNELYAIGDRVFEAPYELYDGVKETLLRDRGRGWQTILYTKGAVEVQQRKIDINDLARHFDHIYIVQGKTKEQLLRIIGACEVDIAESWMIGDSAKDDIAPAQALGLNTALVTVGGHHWAYNDSEIDPPTITVESVRDVPSFIGEYAYGQPASRVA